MKRFEKILSGGLYRSRKGAILGVCRGIAEYFDFSVFWTRAIAIRKGAIDRLKRRYEKLERRLQRMEHTVTSREFDWESRLNG
ncbi:MAG: pspC [Deltaproteobacteria bacterium]|nr:pspC [Deltaproteobacteria bacterium]